MSATAMAPAISPAAQPPKPRCARCRSRSGDFSALPPVAPALVALYRDFPEARRLWHEDNGALPLWDSTPCVGANRERCTAETVLGPELAAQTAAALAPLPKPRPTERVIRAYVCTVCGTAFEHPRSDRKYCSLPCLRKADRERTRARWHERAAELRRASDAG